MSAKEYIAKRTLICVITIFSVIIINFFLFRVMPANPVDILISPLQGQEKMGPEIREALMKDLGLDKPLYMQFFIYLVDVFTLNFGYSFITPRPVISIISERLVNTLVLMFSGNILSVAIAVVLGVIAAWKRGSKTDIGSLMSALILTSMPMFWVGGIILLVFAVRMDLFPMFGTVRIGYSHPNIISFLGDYLHHLFLPMITMALVSFGGLFLIMRNSLLDVFSEDYILTSKAVGLSDRTIIFKNALQNAMLPLITIIAIRLGFMISGSLLTETVFAWPGLGLTIYQAVNSRDYPILQGAFLIITILVVLSNFIAEIIYGYFDPRVRTGFQQSA
jgi:peptide/nickel transport system permease protein